MQSASSNFADAASGATVTWLKPNVRADWGQDGFGAATDYGIPTRVQDLFDDRTVASGWDSANASTIHAQAWANTGGSASDASVSGGYGLHTHTTADVEHYSVLGFDVPDSDVLVGVNFTIGASGASAEGGLVSRYSSATSHYEAQLERHPGSEVNDNWTRTATGGWDVASSGHRWAVELGTPSHFSATGSRGRQQHTAVNESHWISLDTGSSDIEVLVDLVVALATANTAPVAHDIIVRETDTSNNYRVLTQLTTAGQMTIGLGKSVGAAFTSLAGQVTVSGHSAGAVWRIRASILGQQLRAKMWLASGSEPAGWQVTTTLADDGIGGGTKVALRSRFESGNTNALPQNIEWDNLTVTGSPASNINLKLIKRNGATTTLTTARMPIVHTAGETVWLRAQTAGDLIRATAWGQDGGQPVTWDATYTDTGTTLTTGKVGVRSRLATGFTAALLPTTIRFPEVLFVSGAIDNLSDQVNDAFEVTHALDDGMPDAVAFVSGVGVPELSVGFGDGRDGLTAAQYFSPFNTDSPVYGFDRDVAPVTLDQGLITPAGPEEVRLFTGRMTDVGRNGGDMSAISATRLKLAKLVQPPPVYAARVGGDATWLVSWALHECGVYPSPPARDGCVWHTTGHGTVQPSIPYSLGIDSQPIAVDHNNSLFDLDFVPGPYVVAPDLAINAQRKQRAAHTLRYLGDGDDALSRAGNRGRLECWVRGDATNVNAAPGGSGTALVFFQGTNAAVNTHGFVRMGLDNDRHPFVYFTELTNGTDFKEWRYTGPQTLPTDGDWHFVGVGYNYDSGRAWTNLNGTIAASAADIFSVAQLPAGDTNADGTTNQNFNFASYLPFAEAQLTTGENADPDTTPWLNELDWDVGAIVHRSANRFVALAETQQTEAWELIAGRARAELASMRCDEQDVFHYLPASYWAQDEQQIAVETLSTDINAGPLNVALDPTKVRNTVQVSYQQTEVSPRYVSVYESSELVVMPRGTTFLDITLTTPAVELDDAVMLFLTLTQIDGTETPLNESWLTINELVDGSGLIKVYPQAYGRLELINAGLARLRLVNNSNSTVYIVNDGVVPCISIVGQAVTQASATQTAADAGSVAARGERTLTVSIPEIQRAGDAQQIAGILVGELARAVPVLEDVTLFGDPRRQPGDLVTVDDPTQTKANGQYRLSSVVHRKNGAAFTQIVRARRALPLAVWDQTNWDECIWAE